MAQELTQNQYYDHSFHIATYYALYLAMEQWLASMLFHDDLSRIYVASPTYAYRRRFELTDTSQDYATLPLASLQFPFASYWPHNTGWRPDRRIAAPSAAMIEVGIDVGSRHLRAMPVVHAVPVILHFNREDDARLAYEELLWKSFHEQYTKTTLPWRGVTLDIPLNIAIDNLSFNPRYQEKDWLEGNKIFVVEVTLHLRSYIIKMPPTENGVPVDPFYFLSKEAILQLANDKGLSTELVVRGMFDDAPSIVINKVAAEQVKQSSAKLIWDVGGAELQKILLTLPSGEVVELDPHRNSYNLSRLIEGSDYAATLTFISVDGASKSVAITFTTQKAKARKGGREDLVGTNW